MALYTDIPTRDQIDDLLRPRAPGCVTIYLPTTPLTRDTDRSRLELRNLADEAVASARDLGVAADDVDKLEEELADLVDDRPFWTTQAVSLAVFATPDRIRTHRLANRLSASVTVADRFRVVPLMRAVAFPHAAWVLAVAKGGVRLLEVGPEGPPTTVEVPDLPTDAWEAQPGDKLARVRATGFARAVDRALRAVVGGSDVPLILAATDDLAARYRQVSSIPNLVDASIAGSPKRTPDGDLAVAARSILDDLYAARLREFAETFERRTSQGRAVRDLADLARFATRGALATVWVDLDARVAGSIDDATGAVSFADDDAGELDVVDEIARRVHQTGGNVLVVRGDDVPGGGPMAGVLRYLP